MQMQELFSGMSRSFFLFFFQDLFRTDPCALKSWEDHKPCHKKSSISLPDCHLEGKSSGWCSLYLDNTSFTTAIVVEKNSNQWPFLIVYTYIFIYRMKILHMVTLNSKLLHFGQELQFDRGRSFDELLNRGPFEFNTDFLFPQKRGKPPLYCLHFPPF